MVKNQTTLQQLIFVFGNIVCNSFPKVPLVGFGLALLILEVRNQRNSALQQQQGVQDH